MRKYVSPWIMEACLPLIFIHNSLLLAGNEWVSAKVLFAISRHPPSAKLFIQGTRERKKLPLNMIRFLIWIPFFCFFSPHSPPLCLWLAALWKANYEQMYVLQYCSFRFPPFSLCSEGERREKYSNIRNVQFIVLCIALNFFPPPLAYAMSAGSNLAVSWRWWAWEHPKSFRSINKLRPWTGDLISNLSLSLLCWNSIHPTHVIESEDSGNSLRRQTKWIFVFFQLSHNLSRATVWFS